MARPDQRSRFLVVTGVIVLVALAGVAFELRHEDPRSTASLPAEEPYVHMTAVREHLRTAGVGPFTEEGVVHPPGIPALLASIWVYTGADLQEITRLVPVGLGVIGVLGMAVLLWRHVGGVAAIVGGLGYAVAPEVVFRSSMMGHPSVLAALVPVLLYALLEVSKGTLRWGVVAGSVVLFLAFLGPGFLVLLLLPVAVWCAYCLLADRPQDDMQRLGPVVAMAIVAGGAVASIASPGRLLAGMGLEWGFPIRGVFLVLGVSILMVVGLAILAFNGRRGTRRFKRFSFGMRWVVGGFLVMGALGGMILAGLLGVSTQLHHRYGWAILIVALAGLFVLPRIPNRIGVLAGAVTVMVFPLVVMDFGMEPWVHHAGLVLGVGLVILLGVASAAIVRRTVDTVFASNATPSSGMALPVILIVLVLGGAVYSTADGQWDWHRVYEECPSDALQEIGADMDRRPDAVVVTSSWQSAVVLRAHVEGPHRVVIGDPGLVPLGPLQGEEDEGALVYFLVDPYTSEQWSPDDLDAVIEPSWRVVDTWCGQEEAAEVVLWSTGSSDLS